ncbi:hypothetical protein CON07_20095 [Bacillus sp. AFS094611]|uniref:DUF5677 domain-containing protein n=1 Tax=Bacillus sp. AFS094611 TaxID=2033516 RepID=UPI000BEB93AC|nr:DUF5677 domain-containing protein [Bacillus sp. AFS094611]PDZ49770.1 hypothetical protein CON07_20095 [Bacillus sp. AFS094611]
MERNLENLNKTIVFAESILDDLKNLNDLKLEHKIVISLYRKLLEQTCGGYISAINNLGGPLKIMVRATLETYLALKYILQKEQFIQRRAYSYYIGFLNDIKLDASDWCEHLDLEESHRQNIEFDLIHISKILDSKLLKKVVAEWKNTKRKSGKPYNPKWYSLYGGPQTLQQLAKRLEKEDPFIRLYYSSLSQEAHGYNSLEDTNYFHLIDKPLSLKPIISKLSPDHFGPIRAFCMAAVAEIIVYFFPERRNIYLEFAKEIGMKTEIDA